MVVLWITCLAFDQFSMTSLVCVLKRCGISPNLGSVVLNGRKKKEGAQVDRMGERGDGSQRLEVRSRLGPFPLKNTS